MRSRHPGQPGAQRGRRSAVPVGDLVAVAAVAGGGAGAPVCRRFVRGLLARIVVIPVAIHAVADSAAGLVGVAIGAADRVADLRFVDDLAHAAAGLDGQIDVGGYRALRDGIVAAPAGEQLVLAVVHVLGVVEEPVLIPAVRDEHRGDLRQRAGSARRRDLVAELAAGKHRAVAAAAQRSAPARIAAAGRADAEIAGRRVAVVIRQENLALERSNDPLVAVLAAGPHPHPVGRVGDELRERGATGDPACPRGVNELALQPAQKLPHVLRFAVRNCQLRQEWIERHRVARLAVRLKGDRLEMLPAGVRLVAIPAGEPVALFGHRHPRLAVRPVEHLALVVLIVPVAQGIKLSAQLLVLGLKRGMPVFKR